MAFYKAMEKKTRQEKRTEAFARGGFEEEGSRGNRGGNSNRTGSRPQSNNGYGEHRQNNQFGGETRSYGNTTGRGQAKNGYGEHRQNNQFGGETRSYGNTTGRGQAKNGYGEHRQSNQFGGETRSYGNTTGRSQAKNGYGEHRQSNQLGGENRSFSAPSGNRTQGKSFSQAKPSYEKSRFTPAVKTPAAVKPSPAPVPAHEQHHTPKPEPVIAPKAPVARIFDDDGDEVPPENLLSGRNPIREALKAGRDIEKLMVAKGELTGSAREIIALAKELHIPIQEVERSRLDAITRNHQGMLAFASAHQYSTVEHMLELAESRHEPPFLILLDGITDPHNLGAIIRSAECAGAHGVIVQERRAVGLTPAAVKASAGAVEYLPVARVTNMTNIIEILKAKNIWVYAADMAGDDYTMVDLTGPIALVIGAEGDGIGMRVRAACDRIISLPNVGHVDSLNASVAAGVLMYSIMRARK